MHIWLCVGVGTFVGVEEDRGPEDLGSGVTGSEPLSVGAGT